MAKNTNVVCTSIMEAATSRSKFDLQTKKFQHQSLKGLVFFYAFYVGNRHHSVISQKLLVLVDDCSAVSNLRIVDTPLEELYKHVVSPAPFAVRAHFDLL